nr:ROK family protein [Angustibacter aerolatus]
MDVGGTKIAAGVVDEEGAVLASALRDTSAADPVAIQEAIADVVAELRAQHEVSAVGVAAAGFVDFANGVLLFAPNINWRDEPLRDGLQARTGLPVVVENDANAAAWGEFRFGPARHVDDMVAVTIGTGVGGGVVSGGQMLRGAKGMAGELGHVRLVPDGLPCGCGNHGCWEMYASGNALQRNARALVQSGAPEGRALAEPVRRRREPAGRADGHRGGHRRRPGVGAAVRRPRPVDRRGHGRHRRGARPGAVRRRRRRRAGRRGSSSARRARRSRPT